jgi:hypothetical protein
MDKAEFIEQAPQYYSLAIIIRLYTFPLGISRQNLEEYYSDKEGTLNDGATPFFGRDRVLDRAVRWLAEYGYIEVITDPFGPLIIRPVSDFTSRYDELSQDQNFPLFKYRAANNELDWVIRALRSVDQEYIRLKLTDADFEEFEEPDKEWEPLPLERQDPQLQKAIEAVDDVAEKVRADNGYAANLPEERGYVLDNLSALSRKLKEAETISVAYLREFAFAPLTRLLRRFGPAAIGLAASVAKEALKDWLKRKGIALFDYFL